MCSPSIWPIGSKGYFVPDVPRGTSSAPNEFAEVEPSFNAPKSPVILARQTVLTMRVPETPPEQPPLECHTWAGFSLVNQPANRRGRGGD
jgi:hypothetical protein